MNSRQINEKTIEEYLDQNGLSPFKNWFDALNAIAATKIITAITKVEHGNMGKTASVGDGVYEIKIDHGPGYRVYFANVNNAIVLLLGGGSKRVNKRILKQQRNVGQTLRREAKLIS